MANYNKTVRNRTLIYQSLKPDSGFVLGDLSLGSEDYFPIHFTHWPGGSCYVSDGINTVHKWNGIKSVFEQVGLETPSGTPAFSTSGSGTIDGDYIAYVQFLDVDGVRSPLSTASATVTATDDATVTYTSIPVPTDTRVTSKQILRSTAGQATTFYVDVDTTDVAGTTFTSTNTDTTLATQTSISIFDPEGRSMLTQWNGPRNDKPILAPHRSRMFAGGEVAYTQGNVSVTSGSTTVTGIGTNWKSTLAARKFFVRGHDKEYTISSVSESAQTLTLSEAFRGADNAFGQYQIRPLASQRTTLYYSEANEPDQWPTVNTFKVAETGEVIQALVPTQSFLYVCFETSVYRFTYESDPFLDGNVFLFAYRGCAGQRSWARLGDQIYVLDHLGVWMLEAGAVSEVAGQIRDVFSTQVPGDYKIDWTHAQWFHAVADNENQVVRFFVSLSGPTKPRHALCYSPLYKQWWIEEYKYPILSSTLWQQTRDKILLGAPGLRLMEFGLGSTDGPNATGVVTRSEVTSSTILSVTAPYLVLPSSGVTGSPIAIVEGRGRGQVRIIDSFTAATGLTNITQPWAILPDTTSVVQVGAVQWKWRSGWYEDIGEDSPIEVMWQPVTKPQKMTMAFYVDHSYTPEEFAIDTPLVAEDMSPITFKEGETTALVDLVSTQGYVSVVVSQAVEYLKQRAHFSSVELGGYTGPEAVRIHSVFIGGVRP